MLDFLRSAYLRWPRVFWRLRISPPALPDWRALLEAFNQSGGIWQQDGICGVPLQWTLFRWSDDEPRRLIAETARCAATGNAIETSPPLKGPKQADGARLGVRCARCGIALCAKAAGMQHELSVPSCSGCRTRVRRATAF